MLFFFFHTSYKFTHPIAHNQLFITHNNRIKKQLYTSRHSPKLNRPSQPHMKFFINKNRIKFLFWNYWLDAWYIYNYNPVIFRQHTLLILFLLLFYYFFCIISSKFSLYFSLPLLCCLFRIHEHDKWKRGWNSPMWGTGCMNIYLWRII